MGGSNSKSTAGAQEQRPQQGQPEQYGPYTITQVGNPTPRRSWWAAALGDKPQQDKPQQSGGKKTKKTVKSKPKSKKAKSKPTKKTTK